jgi:hypothetical protein
MFDGTISSNNIGGFANFTQTETLNGGELVKANSVNQKSSIHVTQNDNSSDYILTTSDGRTIGKKSNDQVIEEGSHTNTIQNNKIYDVNDSTHVLGMRNHSSEARYGYYENTSSKLYKYNSDVEPSKLESIRVVSPKLVYGIGESFVKPTVYATYKGDGEDLTDISSSCSFEVGGEDASAATSSYGLNKRVNVYYSENGITVSKAYTIDVYSSAYLTMNPEEVTLDVNSGEGYIHSKVLTAELINKIGAITNISWSSDTSIAAVSNTSVSDNVMTATVTAVAVGTTTVRLSFSYDDKTYNASCRVIVRDTSSGGSTGVEWVKVTSEPQSWAGKYLIVYDNSSIAFDGSLDSLDNVSNYQSVTLSNNKIIGDNNYWFEINSITGGYSIRSASGYYIGRTSDSNGLNTNAETQFVNTISYNSTSQCVDINGSAGPSLQFNKTSGQTRFRYYSSANQENIQLYKKTGGSAEIISISYGFDPDYPGYDENNPRPVTQKVGHDFDPSGMKFFAQFDNGGEQEISVSDGITFDGYTKNTAGTYNVVAHYEDKTITIPNVEWVAKSSFNSVELTGTLIKNEYVAGTTFNSGNLQLIPTYNYGTDNAVNPTTIYFSTNGSSWTTAFPASVNSATQYYVAAGYTDPDLGTSKDTKSLGTTSPTITVYPRELDSLTNTTAPTLSYENNAKFAIGNADIKANYNQSSTYSNKGLNFTTSNIASSVSWHYAAANVSDSSTFTSSNKLTPGTTPLTNATHNGKHVYAVYTDSNAISPNTRFVDCGTLTVSAAAAGWTAVTKLSDINTSDVYIITNDNASPSYYMNGTTNSGHFQGSSYTNNGPATSAAGVFKFEAVNAGSNIYKMKLCSTSKYLTATKAASGGASVTSSSDSHGWIMLVSNSTFNAIYQQSYSSKYAALRCYSNSSWRTY